MASTPELRQQLQSLSISKEQRPRGRAAARTSSGTWTFAKLVLAVAVVAGGYWAYTNRESLLAMAPTLKDRVSDAISKPPEVATITLHAQSDASTPPVLTATGKIVSDHRVEVQTKVSGQIVDLRFEQGDKVERGQILARIEDVNYRARRDEAAAMVEKARANLAYQQFEHDRVTQLVKGTQATDKEMAVAESGLGEAKAQLAAELAALEWATKAYRDTEVVAPIAGVILERNVEIGDFVAAEGGRGAIANAQFAAIADMTKLRVEIDVSELDIARVKTGMPCTIVPDAYKDRKYRGHVLWIDPGANYAKATVQAKVRIDNPDEFLRVEGSAQVQFLTEETSDSSRKNARPTIWIPSTAIKLDPVGGADANPTGASGSVFVVTGGQVKLTPVKLGRSQGGQYEVLDGLSDGQVIVKAELEKLADGQRVK